MTGASKNCGVRGEWCKGQSKVLKFRGYVSEPRLNAMKWSPGIFRHAGSRATSCMTVVGKVGLLPPSVASPALCQNNQLNLLPYLLQRGMLLGHPP